MALFFYGENECPSSKFVLSLISMRICCADQEGESLCFCGETRNSVEKHNRMLKELEADQIYADIQMAKQEWERAMRQFEDAQGQDEIDYAIYVFGGTHERKYQIHLRRAKRARANGDVISQRGVSM